MPMTDFFSGDNLIYLVIIAFYMAMMAILIVRWYRGRGKILVRIHKSILPIEFAHVKPDGDKVPIISGRGRRAEWAPTFTVGCLYQYPNKILSVFPRMSWALDVKEDATQCIDWSQKNPNPPSLSKEDVKEYSEAQAIKNVGKGTKLELPTVFWLSVIGSMGTLILLIYFMNKMGAF